jgi:DNA-binding MarR family transcriptional regulator
MVVGVTNKRAVMPDSDFTGLPTWVLTRAALRSHQILVDHLGRRAASGYQFRVLSVLRSGPITQADIGRRARLDRRDVAVTVGELAKTRLVSRKRSPHDARVQLVSITDQGRERLAELDQAMDDVQEATFGALSPPERRQLLDLLQRIADPDS